MKELLSRFDLDHLKDYFADPPRESVRCFCHGDGHYANILWNDHHISAILDFEMAGYGDRDFDIAWALFRRPGQKFMKTGKEIGEFLKGYGETGEYDYEAVRFYMAQCYVYFLQFSVDDAEYCKRHHIDLEDLYHSDERIAAVSEDILGHLSQHTRLENNSV